MICTHLRDRRYFASKQLKQTDLINNLIESRNLFSVQNIEYDLATVTSLDLDDDCIFMLAGLSNGSVDLKEVIDPLCGTLSHLTRFNFGQNNINRVQWTPGGHEQFFSLLDNHLLLLVDPSEMRVVDRYEFHLKTNWSEWNPTDRKMIAVCGSESQVRLVDIRSGSSVQTVILSAPSRLATHRATRCLWSRQDLHCLVVGDNEGYLHVYDTRRSSKPLALAGEERGQISGMSFTKDQCSIITTQGTENHLVQWTFNNCILKPSSHKFKKRPKPTDQMGQHSNGNGSFEQQNRNSHAASSSSCDTSASRGVRSKALVGQQKEYKKQKRRAAPLPVDAYIRCQFHVTDRHVFCPAPSSSTKSKELYIYDIESGTRIKTLKSDGILSKGVYAVSSLLPESLVIYVGGRGRLKAWTIEEGHQRKMEERMRAYHQTQWDSDDEGP